MHYRKIFVRQFPPGFISVYRRVKIRFVISFRPRTACGYPVQRVFVENVVLDQLVERIVNSNSGDMSVSILYVIRMLILQHVNAFGILNYVFLYPVIRHVKLISLKYVYSYYLLLKRQSINISFQFILKYQCRIKTVL